jgi:hypothetical protein
MSTNSAPVASQNPFLAFLERYRDNPVLFAQEVIGVTPDPWQADCLKAVGRGERKIAVRSGHGVGKTTWVSWAAIWFIFTRYPVKIVATSQSAPQLFDAFFAELKRWIKELRPELQALLDPKADRIELLSSPTEAFISARTSRAESPEALAGVHSEHVMLIGDEASGIPEQVYQAAGGSMSGHNAITILTGNPIRSSGYFYDVFHKMKDRWWTLRVSCLDSPRVSKEYVEDIAAQYGSDSNVYRVRVLGEFPRSDDDTVIPMELIEAAVIRETVCSPTAPVVWGLDVARFGNDDTCLCKRQANIIPEPPRTWHGLDLMQTSMMVKAEYDATENSRRPLEILVDSIGIGAGVVDRLRELGLPARGINVSELPSIGGTHLNLRSELWFKAKSWLEKRDCSLPKHERLQAELATVRYMFQPGSGKLKIESKDDMKKRGLRSPDVADSFVLCFASDAGTALFGTSYNSSWAKPVRRGLIIV